MSEENPDNPVLVPDPIGRPPASSIHRHEVPSVIVLPDTAPNQSQQSADVDEVLAGLDDLEVRVAALPDVSPEVVAARTAVIEAIKFARRRMLRVRQPEPH